VEKAEKRKTYVKKLSFQAGFTLHWNSTSELLVIRITNPTQFLTSCPQGGLAASKQTGHSAGTGM